MGESIVYALKMALAVTVFAIFMSAIVALVGFIIMLASNTILAEIIGLISIYLPFNPAPVFASVSGAIGGIISFLIAKKIYLLTTNMYQST